MPSKRKEPLTVASVAAEKEATETASATSEEQTVSGRQATKRLRNTSIHSNSEMETNQTKVRN
jgi:hypothetical protein